MSTTDCPGYGSASFDKLMRGCWAEHEDGSLIYIKDIDENDRVIFELYELKDKVYPVYYQHALAKKDFEKTFSFDPKKKKNDKINLIWSWHNRTPFPWDKVMKYVDRPVPVAANVEDQVSAVAKVVDSLHIRMREVLDRDHVLAEQGLEKRPISASSKTIFQRLRNAMNELVH